MESGIIQNYVRDILSTLGKPHDLIKQDDVAVVCKNACNLRLVRTRSLEDEYTKVCFGRCRNVTSPSFKSCPQLEISEVLVSGRPVQSFAHVYMRLQLLSR